MFKRFDFLFFCELFGKMSPNSPHNTYTMRVCGRRCDDGQKGGIRDCPFHFVVWWWGGGGGCIHSILWPTNLWHLAKGKKGGLKENTPQFDMFCKQWMSGFLVKQKLSCHFVKNWHTRCKKVNLGKLCVCWVPVIYCTMLCSWVPVPVRTYTESKTRRVWYTEEGFVCCKQIHNWKGGMYL